MLRSKRSVKKIVYESRGVRNVDSFVVVRACIEGGNAGRGNNLFVLSINAF